LFRSRFEIARADGPVLSTTELYLLQTELQLNPILTNSNPGFHLIFHLQTGKPSHPFIDRAQVERPSNFSWRYRIDFRVQPRGTRQRYPVHGQRRARYTPPCPRIGGHLRIFSVVHDRQERTGRYSAGCLYDYLERVRPPSMRCIRFVGILTQQNLRYTDNYVTDSEFSSLPPRLQDALRRTATNNQNNSAGWNMYYTPAQVPNRYKRIGASSS